MPHNQLDAQLRARTRGELGLSDAGSGYLAEVRRAAAVLDVELGVARYDDQRMLIELALTGVNDIVVRWTPFVGWFFTDNDSVTRYRVGVESDVASMLPDPDTVAGWLRVLADGDRTGHTERPDVLDATDDALVVRLTTFGRGEDSGVG